METVQRAEFRASRQLEVAVEGCSSLTQPTQRGRSSSSSGYPPRCLAPEDYNTITIIVGVAFLLPPFYFVMKKPVIITLYKKETPPPKQLKEKVPTPPRLPQSSLSRPVSGATPPPPQYLPSAIIIIIIEGLSLLQSIPHV